MIKLFESVIREAKLEEMKYRDLNIYAPIKHDGSIDIDVAQTDPDLHVFASFVKRRADRYKGFALIDNRPGTGVGEIVKYFPV